MTPRAALLLLFAATVGAAPALAQQQGTSRVAIETEAGKITVALDVAHAPITSCNFLQYVRARAYDEGIFYRSVHKTSTRVSSVPIEVVQAGARKEAENRFAPIQLETTQKTGLTHRAGAISMARSSADSATSSFFIVVEDSPELNFAGRRNADGQGFAAFGYVTEGMDVVRTIHARPEQGEAIVTPVKIAVVRMLDGWPKACSG